MDKIFDTISNINVYDYKSLGWRNDSDEIVTSIKNHMDRMEYDIAFKDGSSLSIYFLDNGLYHRAVLNNHPPELAGEITMADKFKDFIDYEGKGLKNRGAFDMMVSIVNPKSKSSKKTKTFFPETTIINKPNKKNLSDESADELISTIVSCYVSDKYFFSKLIGYEYRINFKDGSYAFVSFNIDNTFERSGGSGGYATKLDMIINVGGDNKIISIFKNRPILDLFMRNIMAKRASGKIVYENMGEDENSIETKPEYFISKIKNIKKTPESSFDIIDYEETHKAWPAIYEITFDDNSDVNMIFYPVGATPFFGTHSAKIRLKNSYKEDSSIAAKFITLFHKENKEFNKYFDNDAVLGTMMNMVDSKNVKKIVKETFLNTIQEADNGIDKSTKYFIDNMASVKKRFSNEKSLPNLFFIEFKDGSDIRLYVDDASGGIFEIYYGNNIQKNKWYTKHGTDGGMFYNKINEKNKEFNKYFTNVAVMTTIMNMVNSKNNISETLKVDKNTTKEKNTKYFIDNIEAMDYVAPHNRKVMSYVFFFKDDSSIKINFFNDVRGKFELAFFNNDTFVPLKSVREEKSISHEFMNVYDNKKSKMSKLFRNNAFLNLMYRSKPHKKYEEKPMLENKKNKQSNVDVRTS